MSDYYYYWYNNLYHDLFTSYELVYLHHISTVAAEGCLDTIQLKKKVRTYLIASLFKDLLITSS